MTPIRFREFPLFFWTLVLTSALILSAMVSAHAATAGLPFTEDFSASDLRDDSLTSADWSTAEQAVFLAWSTRRQLPRYSATGTAVDSETDFTWSVVLGDVDGDGDLDLVAGNFNQSNTLYRNDGNGGFPAIGTAVGSEVDDTRSVVLGDVDGDGALDLIAGNFNQSNKLYLNDGNGSFPASGTAVGSEVDDTGATFSVVLGDVDGDGALDLIAGNFNQSNKLYLNAGNGSFPASGTAVGSEVDDTRSVVLGDVDGDGALDLVAGNFNQSNTLYLNDGSGGFPATGTAVGSDIGATFSVALGDVDGDGALDLVTGNFDQRNILYLNDGNGSFLASGTAVGSEVYDTRSVVLGDVDGDGALDLVAGNFNQSNTLYLNDGSGGFPAIGTAVGSDTDPTASVALGDVDSDGDLDLVAGNFNQSNKLYRNAGNGSFPATGSAVGSDTDATVSVVLGDVDGDGDLDLVAGNYAQTNKLYLNDGSGGFPATGTAVGSDTDFTGSVVLGDVDGDGDLDLVVGNYNQINKLYLNDGNGSFPASGNAVGSEVDDTRSVVLGDVDGDGDLDLVAGNYNQGNTLYLNDGSGGFPAAGTAVGSDTDATYAVVLRDIDYDGDLDLVAGNGGQTNKLYLNDGSGGFPMTGMAVGSESDATFSFALGDVDGDGDLDLIAGNGFGQTNKLYRNDGSGGFDATGTSVGGETESTRSLVLGDVDGDGDLDLVVGILSRTNKLYLNDGSGGFPATGTAVGSETDSTWSAVLGDVDSDGDLDLVAGNLNQSNRLYLNDDSGGFSATGTAVGNETDQTWSVALGDVDGDGDLDLVAGTAGATNKLYLNDGSGGFPATGTAVGTDTDAALSVALGDVDGDGDLDLVAGNYGARIKYYRNDGGGGFSTSGTTVGSETDFTRSMVLGDVDGDGDLDVVAGNDVFPGAEAQTNKLYLNDGDGVFTAPGTVVGSEAGPTWAVVLGDVDGDGDLDLVAGNFGQPDKLYLNDGTGGFPGAGTIVGSETSFTQSLVLGDVDGDGDLDLVAGTLGATNKLYLNDGSGGFPMTGTAVGSETEQALSLVLGDVDGDGDLDLIAGNAGPVNRLYLNDGSGGFPAAGTIVGSEVGNASGLVLGDVDDDGDLDLIAASANGTRKLYRTFSYLTTGSVVSTTVNTGEPVPGVILSAASSVNTPTTRNTVIDYFVSNNGGLNWYRTYPGLEFLFPASGTDLRWKAELTSLSPARSPILSQVSLELAIDEDLSDLALSAGTLSPAFMPEITAYSAGVASANDSITVTPTLVDANATVTVDGIMVTSGQPSGAIALDVGDNTITVAVAGNTTKSTTVTVSRTATIGGTVMGLAPGNEVVLQNNGGDNLTRSANGGFSFATELADTSSYEVTVLIDPTAPNQTCEVANDIGIGMVDGANVTDIEVTCITDQFTVGGTIDGLAGSGLVLRTNGIDLPIAETAAEFTFPAQDDGTGYDVEVATQPTDLSQTCSVVTNNEGTLVGMNVTIIEVTCTTNQFTVGGTIDGLAGNGLVLRSSSVDLPVGISATDFTFPAQDDGTSYDVEVATQPTDLSQTCSVTNNEGTLAGVNVTNIEVSCITNQFTVGGTIDGLAGSGLVLRTNGIDLPVGIAATGFTFTAQDDGTGYDVEVATQPTDLSQTCSVSNETGTLAGMGIANVEVTCITDRFTVGGTVSGLLGDQVVLQNDGGDQQVQTSDGGFSFSARDDGTGYAVTVLIQPNSPIQFCSVSDDTGAGTLSGADVTTVIVDCVAAFTVGGTVSGLQLPGLVLEFDDGSLLLFDQDGPYTFSTGLADGTDYIVTAPVQPKDHDCSIANAADSIAGADVVDVDVDCTTDIDFADDFETLSEAPVDLN